MIKQTNFISTDINTLTETSRDLSVNGTKVKFAAEFFFCRFILYDKAKNLISATVRIFKNPK